MKNYPNNCLNQLGITNTYFNLEHLIFLLSLDRDNFGAILEQDQLRPQTFHVLNQMHTY